MDCEAAFLFTLSGLILGTVFFPAVIMSLSVIGYDATNLPPRIVLRFSETGVGMDKFRGSLLLAKSAEGSIQGDARQ